MDPAEQQITVPEVALFLHSADTFGRRHISISLASLVSLMLRQEIVEVQRIFIGKSIAELPNAFDAPTGLLERYIPLEKLPVVAKQLVAIFIDAEFDDTSFQSFGGKKISFLPFRELAQACCDLGAVTEILQQILADTAADSMQGNYGLGSFGAIASRITVWGARTPHTQIHFEPQHPPQSVPHKQHNHQDLEPKSPVDPSCTAPIQVDGVIYIALYPSLIYLNGGGTMTTMADARRWFNRAKAELRPQPEHGEEFVSQGGPCHPGQLPRTRYTSFSYLRRIIEDTSAIESIIPKDRLAPAAERQAGWLSLCQYIENTFGEAAMSSSLAESAPKRRKIGETETDAAAAQDILQSLDSLDTVSSVPILSTADWDAAAEQHQPIDFFGD